MDARPVAIHHRRGHSSDQSGSVCPQLDRHQQLCKYLDYSKVTHINVAFENANSAGNLSFNSAENNIITKAHANGVKY